jgi:peptide deformylase
VGILILEILTHPNEMLLAPTEKVSNKDKIQEDIKNMLETWESMGGALGLAANQVGIPKSICIYTDDGEPHVLINPEITARFGKQTSRGEGCLSVPDERFDVKRSKRVVVTGFDADWNLVRIKTTRSKLLSTVLQHEIDHLNGITVKEKGKKCFL